MFQGCFSFAIFMIFSELLIFIRNLFSARPNNLPPAKNLLGQGNEEIPDSVLNLGNIYMGGPGSGKTTSLVTHRVEYDIRHPKDASFAFDESGSYIDDYISYASSKKEWPELWKRIRILRLGHKTHVCPIPEFSPEYDTPYESQIRRVQKNFDHLLGNTKEEAVVVGGVAIEAVLPHTLRLMTDLSAVTPYKEPFQITELPALLSYNRYMSAAKNKCGESLNKLTREFFETRYFGRKAEDIELRSLVLTKLLTTISTQEAIACLGNYRPRMNPKTAIENGEIVFFEGTGLLNQPYLLHYLFAQYFSLIMEQINLRSPHDPDNNSVAIIFEETVRLLENPGISEMIGNISNQYRSRNVQVYLDFQDPVQLNEKMQELIWVFRNHVIFRINNKRSAERAITEILTYDAQAEKAPAATINQNPVFEYTTGVNRISADWLANLPKRACIVRDGLSPFVRFISQTREVPPLATRSWLEETKEMSFMQIAEPIRDILAIHNERLRWLDDGPTGKTPKPMKAK